MGKKNKSPTRSETYGNVELRFRDGQLDEVVLSEESRCTLHVEKMYDGCWCVSVYGDLVNVQLDLHSEKPILGQVRRPISKKSE